MQNPMFQQTLDRLSDWWQGVSSGQIGAQLVALWQRLADMGDLERWALFGVSFLLFLMVLNRLERQARNYQVHRDAVTGDATLVYAPARRTLARINLLLGFLLLGAGLSLGGMPVTVLEWLGLLIAMVFLVHLPIYLILEVDRRRVLLSSRDVTVHSPFRRPRTLYWDDVTGMDWNHLRHVFTLHGEGGEKLTIPDGLAGLEHLERRCQARLTADRFQQARAGFR